MNDDDAYDDDGEDGKEDEEVSSVFNFTPIYSTFYNCNQPTSQLK